MDYELMKEAYGMLYRIENNLREKISISMEKKYGIGWMISAPAANKFKPFVKNNLQDFYLHELVSVASMYSCISIKSINELLTILPIRNKIAHCNLLNIEEFNLLKQVSIS